MVKPNAFKSKSSSVSAKPPKVPTEKPKKEKKERLPLRDRTTILLTKQEARMLRFAKSFAAWGSEFSKEASGYLNDAAENIHAAVDRIEKLPADFRRGGRAGRDLSPGAICVIAENRREYYSGAIESDDQLHLEIVKIVNSGKTALVQTKDGTRTMVPTSHLRNAPVVEEDDAEESEEDAA